MLSNVRLPTDIGNASRRQSPSGFELAGSVYESDTLLNRSSSKNSTGTLFLWLEGYRKENPEETEVCRWYKGKGRNEDKQEKGVIGEKREI